MSHRGCVSSFVSHVVSRDLASQHGAAATTALLTACKLPPAMLAECAAAAVEADACDVMLALLSHASLPLRSILNEFGGKTGGVSGTSLLHTAARRGCIPMVCL